MRRPDAGACESCVHQQLVGTTRGSEFSLCRRSREDSRFAKYPPLPVLRCWGHEPREPRPGDAPAAPRP